MSEDIVALSPVRAAGAVASSALLLAGAAWAVRAGWELRLAGAGEPAGGPPDQGDGRHRALTSLENGYHLVSSAGGVVTAVCVIAFLVWLGRVRGNARVVSGQAPRYNGFWVLLGWVIPIANLWIPRGIVADVYRDSAPERRLPRVVNVWWGLWLVGLLSGTGLVYSDSTDELIARAYDNVWPLVLSDLALVGAAVAGATVVRAVTRVQVERAG
ncbi:uncharacterized protein DUF4328 [Streptomyces sp. Ag109_O5-1]|uniref:DUF4328 domain-containing protein n=1 Tax=Streptomyces sp. Ag109_O5-1 TaxID=1938851 RepID=UPI000F4E616D|nr:DUF4328 domain-containing protein [Streptomyces sp. Ag109_O5-1]RPE42325.1 uncharacterized protein DUF4328 [Streptomyces sp. Ag109_O5-1]